METKEQLVNTIRKWIKMDNEIRALQKESNKRKNDKKKISSDLIEVMKKNEIDCFDINDGQILYSKKSVKKPITQKVLLDILSTYFKGDALKASEINNFIMESRESVTKETIVRKIFKDNEEEDND
jgi:seryl-tRNA synthetase